MVPEIVGYKDKDEHIDSNGIRSVVYLMDCNDFMRQIPDGFFQLSVVDPPYGIDAASILSGPRRKSGNGAACKSAFDKKEWDQCIPNAQYFQELFRVSQNQIIWGGQLHDGTLAKFTRVGGLE